MSWEENDIDNLFRNSGSGSVPPFDDSFWSEMEAMLPDDGKGVDGVFVNAALDQTAPVYKEAYWKEMQAILPGRKRRIAAYWWYGAAGALVLLFGIGAVIMSGNLSENNDLKAPVAINNNVPQKNSEAAPENPAGKNWRRVECYIPEMPGKNPFRESARNSGVQAQTALQNQVENPEDLKNSSDPVIARELNTVDPLEKLQTGVSYNMARACYDLPPVPEKEPLFYVQAGAGIGQSFINNAPGSELVHFYSLGAGIQKQLGSMYLSFGLNGRVDFVDNIQQIQENTGMIANPSPASGTYTRSDFRQLYAVETPLMLAFGNGKNKFGALIVPGLQLGYTGTYVVYDLSQDAIKRGRASGKMPQSRTLTMEIGLVYMRRFNRNWSAGCNVATDFLTPIGEKPYVGEYRTFPLNGGIFLRRNF